MKQLKKIILVEDDDFDAEITIKELEKTKVLNPIIRLETGLELIEYLKEKRDEDIAVIILDLNMPVLSGIEALEMIPDETTKKIPIVVLSSSKHHPDIKKSYDLGANSYIEKPVKTADFQKTVNTMGLYWGILNHTP